jgi:hypothetical protein
MKINVPFHHHPPHHHNRRTSYDLRKQTFFSHQTGLRPLSANDNDTAADNEAEIDTQPETSNQGQQNTTNTTFKIILPPPIFIKGVHDYLGLCNHPTEVTAPDSFSCKLTTNHLKIQADTPNSYRNIIRYLKETNTQFHTYQPQSDKPLRVVIRNLHPSTPEEDIASAIAEIGHTVRNVTNVRHQQTKTPLPLFFVDLDPNNSDSDIFSIEKNFIKSDKYHSAKIANSMTTLVPTALITPYASNAVENTSLPLVQNHQIFQLNGLSAKAHTQLTIKDVQYTSN